MIDPEEVHAEARTCPWCEAERIPGQLLGGTKQQILPLVVLGPVLGNSAAFNEETSLTFSPATPHKDRSRARYPVVALACTNCGFIGLFVLHPEHLPTNGS